MPPILGSIRAMLRILLDYLLILNHDRASWIVAGSCRCRRRASSEHKLHVEENHCNGHICILFLVIKKNLAADNPRISDRSPKYPVTKILGKRRMSPLPANDRMRGLTSEQGKRGVLL